MKKKSVGSTQKTSKAKTEKKVNLNIAIRYFWDFATTSWEHANTHQERLAARRPMLTKDYIAAQLAKIVQVKALPANDVRTAKSTKMRKSLSAHRRAVMTEVNMLDSAIAMVYEKQPDLIPVERKEAGITELRTATARDWAAVSSFLIKAEVYLKHSGQLYVDAGAIAPDFAANLVQLGYEFNQAKTAYINEVQVAKDGTDLVAEEVELIKSAISKMQEVGKTVFEFEPALRKLFTAEYVLNEVRSKHPANIVGRTDLGPVEKGTKAKPLAGISVEVVGQEGKVATTDKLGRYKIPIAGGGYTLRFSGSDMAPVEMKVTVQPGRDRRVNVALEPMSVVEARASAEITPTTPTNDTQANAVKEVANVPVNGEDAPQNGHAVA